jgi:hypothetical protein
MTRPEVALAAVVPVTLPLTLREGDEVRFDLASRTLTVPDTALFNELYAALLAGRMLPISGAVSADDLLAAIEGWPAPAEPGQR